MIEEDELDLREVWKFAEKNIVIFITVLAVCCSAVFLFMSFGVAKKYTSSAKVIIVSKDYRSDANSMNYTDVQLAQKLTNTYTEIMKSEAVLDVVAENLASRWGTELSAMKSRVYGLKVTPSENTEIISVSSTTTDPQLSADIVNEAVAVFENKIYDILAVENVTVLTPGKVAKNPSGPNVKKYVAVMGAGVTALYVLYVFLVVLFDTKVKTEEDLKKIFDYPVIGSIPEYDIWKGKRG